MRGGLLVGPGLHFGPGNHQLGILTSTGARVVLHGGLPGSVRDAAGL